LQKFFGIVDMRSGVFENFFKISCSNYCFIQNKCAIFAVEDLAHRHIGRAKHTSIKVNANAGNWLFDSGNCNVL